MSEDWSGTECGFESFKTLLTCRISVPNDILASESSKRNGDLRITMNEPSVEITESQERLYVLHFLGGCPISYGFYLFLRHVESAFGKNKTKIFHSILVEFAFGCLAIEIICV